MEISTGLPNLPIRPSDAAAEAAARPGRAEAPGQLARQAVSAARAAGAELPANAQGIAASQIARGADPASVFAAQVSEDPAPPAEPASAALPAVTTERQTAQAAAAPQPAPLSTGDALPDAMATPAAAAATAALAGYSAAETAVQLLVDGAG